MAHFELPPEQTMGPPLLFPFARPRLSRDFNPFAAAAESAKATALARTMAAAEWTGRVFAIFFA
jgi:hypothetical protein